MSAAKLPRARRAATIAAVLALIALLAPLLTARTLPAAYAAASAQTVTGTNYAFDAAAGVLQSTLPTATVSQTQDLVDQTVHVAWTGETPSFNDQTHPENTTDVTLNSQSTYYAVGVFECKGAKPAKFSDCFAVPAGATFGSGGLGNAVDTLTYTDGSGFADLHVETSVTNSNLQCDPTHPCSVAVVPAWGGTPAANNNGVAACNDHTLDLPNPSNDYNPLDVTNVYDIGVQECSWANRLVVPLHFAPTPDNCPAANPAFTAVGSPMLERGLSQWQAGWCRDSSPLSFSYNSTPSEYEARESFGAGSGALTSATDVALTTQSAGAKPRGYTYAPIANSDIAVAFLVDNAKTHQEITDITLNARLVAKMLTQSYAPLAYACLSGGNVAKQSATCDPAVRGNPQSILKDPEFLALNPTLSASDFPYVGADAYGAFFPTVVAGNSDLTYELTRWIASDPGARAFLRGQPDKWGMHVNAYYKGIHYPTSQLQQLDPGFVDKMAPAGTGTMQNTWQPISGLDRVGQLLVGNTSTALNNNPNAATCNIKPCSLPKLTEPFGARSLFAIMDQGQAAAYAFPTAKLVNAAGHGVAPTTAGVTAGLAAAQTDADGITQRADYRSRSATAYPLTLTDYAMVHTCGQTKAAARAVSAFLGKVASSQSYGVDPGTIAPGYLRLTSKQKVQLAAARRAVGSHACAGVRATTHHRTSTPSAHATSQGVHPNGGSSDDTGGLTGGGVDNGGVDNGGVDNGTGTDSTVPTPGGATPTPSASPSQSESSADTQPIAYTTHPDSAGAARFALPVLLIAGAVLLLGGPLTYLITTGAGATGLTRFRTLLRSGRRR